MTVEPVELAKRVETLEKQIRYLEDRAEIQQLVATYGPAADSCSDDILSDLWLEDGVYDTDRRVYQGPEGLRDLISNPGHLDFYSSGCAHVLSSPHIDIDGDRATAINYSRVYIYVGEDHWRIKRASANRWELERTPDGWRVHKRIVRNLNGRPEVPQEIFRHGLGAPARD